MKVWGMVLGGYPRTRLSRYSLRDSERGKISTSEYSVNLVKAHSEAIGAQKTAGLPVVVDGMIDWHDIFRPFVESWRNVAVDGLLRYFDNNFFYRIPVFTGEPDIIRPVLAPRVLEYGPLADPAVLKVVVPGPVTMAKLAKNLTEYKFEELAEKIAYSLRMEVEKAVELGAGMVQVDEPILADMDATVDDAALAVDLVAGIVRGFEDKAILAVYFDSPKPEVYEKLLDVRARYLMLDITDARERALKLVEAKGFGSHVPVLGLVDARRIHDDNFDRLISDVETIRKHVDVDEMVFTTTTWMDLIPFRYSLRKTFLLGLLTEKYAVEKGFELVTVWR